MPRIVVVFGATGNQGAVAFFKPRTESLKRFYPPPFHVGSAVVDALLADKTFSPRAVTRNASSEAARQLAARGVEVVTGDLWDKESIKQALTGCEGVFGVSELSYSSNGWYSNCRRSQTIMILAS
jgi:putative NADH-flavin reductase